MTDWQDHRDGQCPPHCRVQVFMEQTGLFCSVPGSVYILPFTSPCSVHNSNHGGSFTDKNAHPGEPRLLLSITALSPPWKPPPHLLALPMGSFPRGHPPQACPLWTTYLPTVPT